MLQRLSTVSYAIPLLAALISLSSIPAVAAGTRVYTCLESRSAGWTPNSNAENGAKFKPDSEPFFLKWFPPSAEGTTPIVLPQIEITRHGSTNARLPLSSCGDVFTDRGAPISYQDNLCLYHIKKGERTSYGLSPSLVSFDDNFIDAPQSINYTEFFHTKAITAVSGGTCVLATD